MTDRPQLWRGQVDKLAARLEQPVAYNLPLSDERISLAPLLGKSLSLRLTGRILCVHCGRQTSKSFNQGYCYPCFQKLAQCDGCIIAPEQCHYDAGTCREPVWADHFCMQDHIVYLANSSGLKVGITRASQVPTRWIDQGASQALAIIRCRSRQQAGFCEAMLRQHVADRTNWRTMLKGEQDPLDMHAEAKRLLDLCANELAELMQRFGVHALSVLNGVEPVTITYPVQALPEKLASLDLEAGAITGMLLGIKGQYLLLDGGVLNVRKYTGYELELALN
jgi:hypothetical protein